MGIESLVSAEGVGSAELLRLASPWTTESLVRAEGDGSAERQCGEACLTVDGQYRAPKALNVKAWANGPG